MTDETNTTGAEANQGGAEQGAGNAGAAASAESGAGAAASAENGGTLAGSAAESQGSAPGADGSATAGDDKNAVGDLQKLRETIAGGDDKLLKQLERYKSVEAISKMVKEARLAAQNAGKPLTLSDKATDDEIKAYREAYGIPPEAKDYPGEFRSGYQATDADKAVLGEFKASMHAANVPPQYAAKALEWYQDFATAQKQELDGNMAKVARETQTALRSEWGGEYDGNIGAVRELMTTHLGEDGFNRMMGMRLQDGSRLQDDPAFVKMMAQIGTDYYGSNAIFNGDIETTAQTAQEKLDGLLKLRVDDPEKYKSDAVQKQVTQLYAQLEKINARK